MTRPVDIDPVLNFLGPRGRFQLWQMMLIAMGGICAQNQLFDIIFIGQDVPYQCAAPSSNATSVLPDLPDVTPTSNVSYEKCSIVVTNNMSNDVSQTRYDCLYGYKYERDTDVSFMSEFGLVCDRYLLVSLSQTFLVLGQALGAFGFSILSDRFGRKLILVGSQLGLLLMGVAIGLAPSYPFLVVFKFLVGACQQGVVASISTMGIELFPRHQRSLSALIIAFWWSFGACSMALFAYCLRHYSWRVLQHSLSSVSFLVVLLQWFLMEESLRWLVANGKQRQVLQVLQRAARANKKNVDAVLATLHHCQNQSSHLQLDTVDSNSLQQNGDTTCVPKTGEGEHKMRGSSAHQQSTTGSTEDSTVDREEPSTTDRQAQNAGREELSSDSRQEETRGQKELSLNLEATRKLTLLDMWRYKKLRFNALLTFYAWFTVAFVVFTLFLMSTSYAGDPYVNYFLAAVMEIPPAVMLYFGVDRLGRKRTVQGLFALASFACIASAVCLMFPGSGVLAQMATVFAMAGMLGSSGAFAGLFLYTPEYFPTNLRNQALGTGSTVGRIGGMIAPFMKNLSQHVAWGPGLISGLLSVVVVLAISFLPETKGKQLPTDIEDIEAWYGGKTTTHNTNRQHSDQSAVSTQRPHGDDVVST